MGDVKRGVVVGLGYHSKFLAGLVNGAGAEWNLRAFAGTRAGTVGALLACRTADALICFGGPAPNSALAAAARRRNIPVIVLWAGSDIEKARRDPFFLEVVKQEGFHHFAVAPWLADEVRAAGVPCAYLPVAGTIHDRSAAPLPKTFSVLTYLPEPRRDFYGAQTIYRLARKLPDVPFHVIGAGHRDAQAPSNVHFHGFVRDAVPLIDASTVLVRMPEHDGQSLMVTEALARARHVIWNYDFPHVVRAESFERALDALKELKTRHESGALQPNFGGRQYVLEHFDRTRLVAGITQALNAAVAAAERRPTRRVHRVAISGLNLFCAEVAALAKEHAPEWETRLLQTNSRLEVLTSIATIASSDVWYSIGGPMDRWVALAAQVLRKPRVIHWVGSDIETARRMPKLRRALQHPRNVNLAEVGWTAAELRSLKFEPYVVPLPPRFEAAQAVPLPQKFTVMLYVPRTRGEFYGRKELEDIMQTFAQRAIRWVIVGGGDIIIPPGVDAQNLRWCDDLSAVYRECTALIRLTPRDGLSLMVLEALSFGRHVLWSQEFPYVHPVYHARDVERELTSLLNAHERGSLQPQFDAAEMVAREYSAPRCLTRITEAWSFALRDGNSEQIAIETT